MTPPRGPCDKGTVPIHVDPAFLTSPPACPTVGLGLNLEIWGGEDANIPAIWNMTC